MSAVVKLAGAMPADLETNGLDSQVKELLADRRQIRLALVWYDVSKVTEVTDTAEDIPTVRVRRWEPLGTVEDVPETLQDLAVKRASERTGKTPLPFGEVMPAVEGPEEVE